MPGFSGLEGESFILFLLLGSVAPQCLPGKGAPGTLCFFVRYRCFLGVAMIPILVRK